MTLTRESCETLGGATPSGAPSLASMRHRSVRILAPLALISALALTGCSAMGSGSATSARNPAVDSGVAGGSDGGQKDMALDPATQQRDQVVTGSATVTADHPIAAADEATRIVEAAGGRVDARKISAARAHDAGSANLVLRIPADKLTVVLKQISALGRADQVSTQAEDVTVSHEDLTARITALRASVDRLTSMIAHATKTADLIALESAISDRQAQLESLEGQQRGLEDQIALATITLDLRSPAQAPVAAPGDFWSGLSTGWTAFVAFWGAVLVGIGVAISVAGGGRRGRRAYGVAGASGDPRRILDASHSAASPVMRASASGAQVLAGPRRSPRRWCRTPARRRVLPRPAGAPRRPGDAHRDRQEQEHQTPADAIEPRPTAVIGDRCLDREREAHRRVTG